MASAPEVSKDRFARNLAHGNPLALVAAIIVGLILGYLGWIFPIPGGSVVGPSLEILGIGFAIVAAAIVAIIFAPASWLPWLSTFLVAQFIVTIVMSVWAYGFPLKVAMAIQQPRADLAAEGYLHSLNHGNLQMNVPSTPCRVVNTGHIGPLEAPYQECAFSTAEGHFINFTSAKPGTKGRLTYTDVELKTFADMCYRHLVGRWYTSTLPHLEQPGYPCPMGYSFHGSG